MNGSRDPVAPTEEARILTEGLLSETREELVRADAKASMLLAALGVVVGVVLAGAIAGKWSPSELACGAEIVWWIGAAAAGVGLVALARAVYPRVGEGELGRVTYFKDVLRHKSTELLVDGLKAEAGRGDRAAQQLQAISGIVNRKYRSIQVAMWALLAALILCLGPALLS